MSRDSDPWPDEPREENPEERWGDPEEELSNVPSVDVPDSEPDEETPIDGDLQRAFWATVVLVNVAVAGVSIGAMLVYFRGNLVVGGGAIAVGAFSLVRAYYFYRDFRDSEDADGAGETDGA